MALGPYVETVVTRLGSGQWTWTADVGNRDGTWARGRHSSKGREWAASVGRRRGPQTWTADADRRGGTIEVVNPVVSSGVAGADVGRRHMGAWAEKWPSNSIRWSGRQ